MGRHRDRTVEEERERESERERWGDIEIEL